MREVRFWLCLENASDLRELRSIVQSAIDAIEPYMWHGLNYEFGNYDLGDQEVVITHEDSEIPNELINSLTRAGFDVDEEGS